MQAQEGVLKPPKQHALVQSYSFDNLPLIAMNVARIGAQTPSMAREVGAEAPIGKLKNNISGSLINAVVGFGPMMWILITPDVPVRGGFRAIDGTEINGTEVPETEGDILLYFSSDNAELNRMLATKVQEQFGSSGKLIEEMALEGGNHSDVENEKQKVLIDNSENLDTAQSSFVLTQKFKMDVELSCGLPQHSFSYKIDSGTGRYIMVFSNKPKELEEKSETVSHPAVSRGVFFLPSLDLLTSLRMGGIRMGSLAINAKWKE